MIAAVLKQSTGTSHSPLLLEEMTEEKVETAATMEMWSTISSSTPLSKTITGHHRAVLMPVVLTALTVVTVGLLVTQISGDHRKRLVDADLDSHN